MKEAKKMIIVGVVCTPISWFLATIASQEGSIDMWYVAASALYGTLAMIGLVLGIFGYIMNDK